MLEFIVKKLTTEEKWQVPDSNLQMDQIILKIYVGIGLVHLYFVVNEHAFSQQERNGK